LDYQINLYNLLIGFGMLQAMVFGTLLIWKSSFKEANKYLGICVLFLSFYLIWVLKADYGIQHQFPKLRYLPVLFLWGIGPAFYAYLRFFFRKPIPFKQLRWHFFPLFLELVYFNSCTLIFWVNNWNRDFFNQLESIWVSNLFSVEHIIGLLSIAIYLFKSIQLYRKKKNRLLNKKIAYILVCFSIIWLLWAPYTLVDMIYYNFNYPVSKFYLFYILFTGLTYGIGFIGFRLNAQIVREKNLIINTEIQELAKRIDHVMQKEKYYLNPDLNINDFSKRLDLHPNKISAILNNIMHQSFRDYVNAYRVSEFKMRLKNYDLKNHTILSLAFDVGFNSKASFQRVFKKSMGLSPSDYLEKIK